MIDSGPIVPLPKSPLVTISPAAPIVVAFPVPRGKAFWLSYGVTVTAGSSEAALVSFLPDVSAQLNLLSVHHQAGKALRYVLPVDIGAVAVNNGAAFAATLAVHSVVLWLDDDAGEARRAMCEPC